VAAALLRLNLQGPLALARAALPRMVQQGRGRHVVVASMSGGCAGGCPGAELCRISCLPAKGCGRLHKPPVAQCPSAAVCSQSLRFLLLATCFSLPAAVVPSPGQSVYAAAKSGLRAYFASLSSELSDRWAS
jgi:NAD(P)-dependent dehydrogenase (short-subunit alcohol dehydrogenase family)